MTLKCQYSSITPSPPPSKTRIGPKPYNANHNSSCSSKTTAVLFFLKKKICFIVQPQYLNLAVSEEKSTYTLVHVALQIRGKILHRQETKGKGRRGDGSRNAERTSWGSVRDVLTVFWAKGTQGFSLPSEKWMVGSSFLSTWLLTRRVVKWTSWCIQWSRMVCSAPVLHARYPVKLSIPVKIDKDRQISTYMEASQLNRNPSYDSLLTSLDVLLSNLAGPVISILLLMIALIQWKQEALFA